MNRVLYLFTAILILAVLLRFFYFDVSPPALFTDEANQGYNAYSILKTGKDEHGQFLPVSLRSFGDWKPPMQTYLAIPFIAFFGLNEYTVRLPSMILGVFSIIVTFYLVKKLGFRAKLALLTAFFLTISPWHLHQSRSAMLVIVAFFFFETGILLFLKSFEDRRNWVLSAMLFSLSIYSYYGMRLVIPIFLFFLLYIYRGKFEKLRISLLYLIFSFLVFLLPLAVAFVGNKEVIFGRTKTVSVFYDRGVELRIWELTAQEGPGRASIARFFHNKLYLYTLDITRRFFSHLDGRFLVLQGDTAPPFRIPNMGVLYLFDSIFLTLGTYVLLKEKREATIFFLILLATVLLPAALTFMTPSANRTFNAILPLILFTSYGINFFLSRLTKTRLAGVFLSIVVLGYIWQFSFYLKQYYQVLPTKFVSQWAYGFKDMVQFVQERKETYDKIVVLPQSNMAYIYFLFYTKGEPLHLASQIGRDYQKDEFGFEHVYKMGKYVFLRKGTLAEARREFSGKALFVGVADEVKSDKILTKINYPNGKAAFVITE